MLLSYLEMTIRNLTLPRRAAFSAFIIVGVLAIMVSSGRAQQAELVGVHKIWDVAPHNAFTDLLRFENAWWCVFREGSAHIPGTNGTIRVLKSNDGKAWESAALIREPGIDLRDPKLSITPDGKMMLLMGGSIYAGKEGDAGRKFVTARTRVAFSPDGQTWGEIKPVSVPEKEWLWRVTWHKGVGYGVSYSLGGPEGQSLITLQRTRDGVNYESLGPMDAPGSPNETTLRLLPDDTLLALARGEQTDRHAYLGRSRPPYKTWQWTDTGRAAQGPNFLVLSNDTFIYSGRDYMEDEASQQTSRRVPRTVVGVIRESRCEPLLTLPSGGDTSYPGLVFHEGQLWVSYYASHEGKTSIYLATVRLPGIATHRRLTDAGQP